MQNTNTDNKFLEFLNNNNATFNYYGEMLAVHSDMMNEFGRLMKEWTTLVEKSPDELRLTGLLKPDQNGSDMVLVWLNIKVSDYIGKEDSLGLSFAIKEAFEYACKNEFHAVLCGKAVYKAIAEEIEKRSG